MATTIKSNEPRKTPAYYAELIKSDAFAARTKREKLKVYGDAEEAFRTAFDSINERAKTLAQLIEDCMTAQDEILVGTK